MGLAVAGVCLVAAAWTLVQHRGELWRAVDAVGHAPVWLLAAAIVLPIFNWLLTSLSFWILIRPFGRVGLVEMFALTGASWLANYLPLKPGLVGRIAYHKVINRIAVRDSGRAIIHAVAMSAASAGMLALAALLQARPGGTLTRLLAGAAVVAVAAMAGWLVVYIARAGRCDAAASTGAPGIASSLAAAMVVRIGDATVWVVRYLIAFELLGSPISLVQATAFAAIGQAVASLPIIGSALGVREWAVGILSSVLRPSGNGGGAAAAPVASALSIGLMADFLNRAIEVVLAIPIGLVCSAWLSRRIARTTGGLGRPEPS